MIRYPDIVAKELNRYFQQNLTARVDRMYVNQRTPGQIPRDRFMACEAKKDDIEPHEMLHMVGAVPRGTFNDDMHRHRFEHIMTYLHFMNNVNVQAASDGDMLHRLLYLLVNASYRYATGTTVSKGQAAQVGHEAVPNVLCRHSLPYEAQHVEELSNVPESRRSADPSSGSSTVIRNLEAVLPAAQDGV
ncbi:Hypothetical protein PHPALM_6054 [Phytophthora palmivora]|uniref:Uncharacterized protein n=1 Tax=Phytophthora palmivora TaxID=4796 RepID=A0A2P4YFV1_9STRA|nr:Hypothetical protein PHPALM_6054 [Phytophthora palmivora]